MDLKIPKLRQGSIFPSILERRHRIDRALFAVVMEAYVHGVSTRKVDDLVAALSNEVFRKQLSEGAFEFSTHFSWDNPTRGALLCCLPRRWTAEVRRRPPPDPGVQPAGVS